MKIFLFAAIESSLGWHYPEFSDDWPTNWGESCYENTNGSPIDLDFTYKNFKFHSYDGDSGKTSFKFKNYDGMKEFKLEDNDHSLVLSIENGDTPTLKGGFLEEEYTFHSMHFHWGNRKLKGGSEHTINGLHRFAELHLVHFRTDCLSIGQCIATDEQNALAVLGFFIEIDERINKADIEESFQDFFHESFGMKNVAENETPISSTYTDLNIMEIIGSVDTSVFYRYYGSLTTPTCNEVVKWTVFKDPIRITKSMARKLLKSADTASGELIRDNYRTDQKLNDRLVKFFYPGFEGDDSVWQMLLNNERNSDLNEKGRGPPRNAVHPKRSNPDCFIHGGISCFDSKKDD